MSSTEPTTPTSLTTLHVTWDDPRAVALRDDMEREMDAVYASKRTVQTPEQLARLHAALDVDANGVFDTILIIDGDGTPVAHAALRDLRGEWEMKRVIVDSTRRGLGIGALLMSELEESAKRGGARRIVLQTGDRQPEAVRLYERFGYTPIAIYEPYIDTIPFSLCFEKVLG